MDPHNLKCEISGQQFSLSPAEADFRLRREIPMPRLCPRERRLRRMTFRNQRHLFHRKCSATGKPVISMYSPDYSGPVVSQEYWWSDNWDPLDSGRDFDFTRPFFPQFAELYRSVPQLCTMVARSENCEYNAYCAASKNVYMSQSVAESENVFYSFGPTHCRDCVDCHTLDDCELCFEVVFGNGCYNLQYSRNVAHCRDSIMLANCRSCKNCLFCTNLRNAQYCIENRQATREEFERRTEEFLRLAPAEKLAELARFSAFEASQPAPAIWGAMNENVSGNQIVSSKNVESGFDIIECEDVGHVWRVYWAKSSYDCTNIYYGEELYEIAASLRSTRSRYSIALYDGVYEAEYSAFCFNGSNNLLGCVGLKHADHCIFNQRFTPSEFRQLRGRIIAHMRETGEWGEFFPSSISPFAFNNSIASDFFPLTKVQVSSRGLTWREPAGERLNQGRPAADLQNESDEQLCAATFACAKCGRGYKFQKTELQLLKRFGAAPPDRCFECRYQDRLKRLDPIDLIPRRCSGCGAEAESCWGPETGRIVLCERCYLESIC